jgi:hypothetical protein
MVSNCTGCGHLYTFQPLNPNGTLSFFVIVNEFFVFHSTVTHGRILTPPVLSM